MSKITKVTCDRCNAHIDRAEPLIEQKRGCIDVSFIFTSTTHNTNCENYTIKQHYDLCYNCINSFIKWLD